MQTTVVQVAEMAPESAGKPTEILAFRWSRWVDGDGRLWIVVGSWRANEGGKNVDKVELLDVDNELTVTVPRTEYQQWVRQGTIKRVDLPIAI